MGFIRGARTEPVCHQCRSTEEVAEILRYGTHGQITISLCSKCRDALVISLTALKLRGK